MPLVYAIIPARSGSKGVVNKNIRPLAGRELISYSIRFATKLNVDRIICSTDSEEYASIAKKWGAEVPFLRSPAAATDTAMEQDILRDLYGKFAATQISHPDLLVWLRPTFVFHDVKAVNKCVSRMLESPDMSSCRTVAESECRLYRPDSAGFLSPTFDDHGKSMIRRQDVGRAYKVFSCDVFRSKTRDTSDQFLGSKIGYETINKICGLDIDDEFDFMLVEQLILTQKELVDEYLH